MDTMEAADVVVKKEPIDSVSNELEDSGGVPTPTPTETPPSLAQTRLRYVSRRGRPPGGGYSMKTHAQYIGFNSAAGDLSRHSSLGGSVSSLSTPDPLKSNVSADGIDMRRFGFHGFDGDKSSFRCDGCDVVFSSRDTYAMHMLLRAKNESCVALPTSAISPNPENPTPREKFERELRQQAMLMALRNQAAVMTKAAAAMLPKTGALPDSLQQLTSPKMATKDELDLSSASMAERALNFGSLFCIDAFGVYVDPKQYRRFLSEYGLQSSTSSSSLVSMLEQMTCSLCGEMFSNKDSLAMHVMYHTRDEENENKPGVAWEDLSTNMLKSQTFSSSSNSSSSTSPALTSALSNASKSGAMADKRNKNSQSEDRELTAERVAELKRMAIESSLRSPPKKSSSSGRSQSRPKSVSQDVSVADSAQTRPLSADDVMMLTNGCLKSKTNKSNSQLKDFYDTGFYRKRSSDDKHNDCTSNESTHSLEVKKSKLTLEDSSEQMSRSDIAEDANLDDFQSGGQRNKSDTGKIRSIPYLDAIMAQEAVLVPVETLETDGETSKSKDEVNDDMSALDFSRTGRDRSTSSEISPWYTASSKQEHTDECQGDGVKELVDRYVRSRNLYYPNTSDSSETSGRNHGHCTGANGNSFNGRPSRLTSEFMQTDRCPRGLRGESPGRAGEARYCPHCEILFVDVTLFHLHMGLHNVNNPWQCNTCGLVCSGRLDFNTHVLHF